RKECDPDRLRPRGLLELALLLQHTHERRTLGDRQGQVLGRRAAGGDTERRHRLSPQSDSPSPFPASVAGSMPRSSSPSSSSSSENASVTCAWLIAMTAFFASASFLPPRLASTNASARIRLTSD